MKNRVIITLEGGMIQLVGVNNDSIDVIIKDYDIQGCDDDNIIHQDQDGDFFIKGCHGGFSDEFKFEVDSSVDEEFEFIQNQKGIPYGEIDS